MATYGALPVSEASALPSRTGSDGRRQRFALLGVCAALALFAASTGTVKDAAATALMSAGQKLEALGGQGLTNDEVAAEAECDCVSSCAAESLSKFSFMQDMAALDQPAASGGKVAATASTEAAEATPTASPTSRYTDWTCYFTDGYAGESYVWMMESDYKGVWATVLVDTTGYATGLAVASNETTVYFADSQGSIWKVDNDGVNLKELVSYGGEPMGMDIYESYDFMYWADSDGYVYRASMDGTDVTQIMEGITEPFDVKLNVLQKKIYVSSATDSMIYRGAAMDCTSCEYAEFLSVSHPRGLWVNANDQILYYASFSDSDDDGDEGYIASVSTTEGSNPSSTVLVDGIVPYSVAIDDQKLTVFYTTDDGLWFGELAKEDPQALSGDAEVIARLENLMFVYVVYWAAPTASPTAVPTSTPTNVPTSEPTSLPIPKPTHVPSPHPSALPIPAPSTIPTPQPTDVPIPAPSGLPVPAPSPLPTPVPSQVPSYAPIPAPSYLPTPVPSGMPIPEPTRLPTPKPSSPPSGIPIPAPSPMPTPIPSPKPSPAPTTVCEYYTEQCDLCLCG